MTQELSPKEILSRFMAGMVERQATTEERIDDLFKLQEGQQDALEEQSRSIHDFHATIQDLIARVTALEEKGRDPKEFS